MLGSRASNSGDRDAPYFHRIGGSEIKLTENSTVAERTKGTRVLNGLLFFHRPIRPHEEIRFQILDFDPSWNNHLWIGVTNKNPASISYSSLLQDSIHDLVKNDGWWARSVADTYLQINGIITLKFRILSGVADLIVKKDDEEKNIRRFLHFINVPNAENESNLWMFFYLRGNTIKIQLVGPATTPELSNLGSWGTSCSASWFPSSRPTSQIDSRNDTSQRPLPSSRLQESIDSAEVDDCNPMKWIQECIQSFVPESIANFLMSSLSFLVPSPVRTETNANRPVARSTRTSTNTAAVNESTRLIPRHEELDPSIMATRQRPLPRTSSPRSPLRTGNAGGLTTGADSESSRLRIFEQSSKYPDVIPGSMRFHRAKGANIRIERNKFGACRRNVTLSWKNCYVFFANPIEIGRSFVIRIEGKDAERAGTFTFGVTSCQPDSINSDDLPIDPSFLLEIFINRNPGYWVHTNNVPDVDPGDELCFFFTESGQVLVSRNGGPREHCFNADITIPLWAWFNLDKSVSGIYVLGKRARERRDPSPSRERRPTRSTRAIQSIAPIPPIEGRPLSTSLSPSSRPLPSAPPAHLMDFSDIPKIKVGQTKEEWERMDEKSPTDCVICMDKPVNSVVISCGHLCMCFICAQKYWRSKSDVGCPICRKPITNIIQTYKA